MNHSYLNKSNLNKTVPKFSIASKSLVSKSVVSKSVAARALALGAMALSLILATEPVAAKAKADPAQTKIEATKTKNTKNSTSASQDRQAAQREKTLTALAGRLMKKWNIPACQIAVGKDGKIIESRAFGFCDKELKTKTTTDNVFRIASVSKVFTAAAVHKLIEDGKLKYDDKAWTYISNLKPTYGENNIDPRWKQVTIGQLLTHSGGWTLENGEPQRVYARLAADAAGESRPACPSALVRYMMGKPLQYDPGTKSVYSNFGFNVLGRVIEQASGKHYFDYVRANLLSPSGIEDINLGRTARRHARLNEVYYFAGKNSPDVWSLIDEDAEVADFAYGGDAAIESMDAHGGLVSSAESLVKFGMALNGYDKTAADGSKSRVALIKAETLQSMLKPTNFKCEGKNTVRAYGVAVNTARKPIFKWSHAGALCGTSSLLISLPDNTVLAYTANHLPDDLVGYFTELQNSLLTEVSSKRYVVGGKTKLKP